MHKVALYWIDVQLPFISSGRDLAICYPIIYYISHYTVTLYYNCLGRTPQIIRTICPLVYSVNMKCSAVHCVTQCSELVETKVPEATRLPCNLHTALIDTGLKYTNMHCRKLNRIAISLSALHLTATITLHQNTLKLLKTCMGL